MADKIRSSLLKKHSQSDLVSRLKSRKVLGVGGEDDEGEVHRSKVKPGLKGLHVHRSLSLSLSLSLPRW
uniref:Tumor protein p53-inducible protein 11 n=1 Tax=Callorhinchus milii TaxID=7868 RepID=A0A4W3GT82_CALMI